MNSRRVEAIAKIATLPELPNGKYIPLTKGQVLTVPPDAYELVTQFYWTPIKPRHTYYAVTPMGKGIHRRIVYAHRFLMGIEDDMQVDHENRIGLDCRWDNMREATSSQNGANRGPNKDREGIMAKGVYWDEARTAYRAVMCYLENGIKINKFLGRFKDYDQACAAALRARVRRYGCFAAIE